MYRSLVLAALVPLALGDDDSTPPGTPQTEYSYNYTDAPTMAPTTQTMIPTATNAPTRAETYAPTRMTEAPSYAPTTDTYAPSVAPTGTAAPTPWNCTLHEVQGCAAQVPGAFFHKCCPEKWLGNGVCDDNHKAHKGYQVGECDLSCYPREKGDCAPTATPTAEPTEGPTAVPTAAPTAGPSPGPTAGPTPEPTAGPTPSPTARPTPGPTVKPTPAPSTPGPTVPAEIPTATPVASPTLAPIPKPTLSPTPAPSVRPTAVPTPRPSASPTRAPTPAPVIVPTAAPMTSVPTASPTCLANFKVNLCVALDESGSVCSKGDAASCTGCQCDRGSTSSTCRCAVHHSWRDRCPDSTCDCRNSCPRFNGATDSTKAFATSFIQKFDQEAQSRGATSTQFSVVSFADRATAQQGLTTAAVAAGAVNDLKYTGGYTNTEDALKTCQETFAGNTDPTTRNVMLVFTDGTPTMVVNSRQTCRNYIAADFTDVPYNPNAPDCQQHGNEYCLCAHKAEERATSIKAAGTTISTLFVKPASTATNACPGSASCYPPEKFLAERVASPGLDNTADWNDIDQQVGTLADQIVAKIC